MLEPEDFRVLQLIETGMSSREYVPREQLGKYARLPMDRIEFELSRLDKLGLIYRMKGSYVGYTLRYRGIEVTDCWRRKPEIGERVPGLTQ